jgi:hypothetical protein
MSSVYSPRLIPSVVRPSGRTVERKGQIERNVEFEPYRVLVAAHDRRLADGGLADGGLANRHLANRSFLIDGLRVRKVGSGGSTQHGKRSTCYDQNFHHVIFPQGWKD